MGAGWGALVGGGAGCNHGTWTLGLALWWEQPAVALPPVETVPLGYRDVPDHRPEVAYVGLDPVTTGASWVTVCAQVGWRHGLQRLISVGMGCTFLSCVSPPGTEDRPLSCG